MPYRLGRSQEDQLAKFRIQTHGRIQEWVADEKGYFSAEHLDYEFVDNTLMNDQVAQSSVVGGGEHRKGAFETMEVGNACAVGSACHWAVNQAAATSHGKMWGQAYSMTPAGIYVAADSNVHRPADLANVSVAVGYHSGSHFSALATLQEILADDQIDLVYKGGPQDRLVGLLDGSLQAANLFGNPMYIVEQKGFRKVVDTSFMIGFIVEEETDPVDVAKYFRALQRAQRDIDAQPEKYKHYYLRELPEEYHDQVDVLGFGLGERIVFEPYSREVFESTQNWMKANALFPGEGSMSEYEEAVLA